MNKLSHHQMIIRIANVAIDMTLRAAVLEKVAGLMPGMWSNNPRKFLEEAPRNFPGADPRWFDRRGMMFYNSLMKYPRTMLKDRAEEILGDFFTRDFTAGLAKAIKPLMDDGERGFARSLGIFANRGKQWALDIIRTKQWKTDLTSIEVGPSDENTHRHEPSTDWDTKHNQGDNLQRMMDLMETNPRIKEKVMQHVRGHVVPAHLRVWEAKLAHPEMSNQELGVSLGYEEKYAFSFVSKALKAVNTAIIGALELPQVQDAIELSFGRVARRR